MNYITFIVCKPFLLCIIEVKEFSEDLSAAELALWLQSKHVPKDDCNIIRGQ